MSVIRGNLVGTTMSPERIAERIGGTGGSAEGAVLYTPQELTEEQREQARQNIDVPSWSVYDRLNDALLESDSEHDEAEYALGQRMDKLEQGYRHIATYEHTEDEGVKQIDITVDENGDAFECSDFLIYLTLPTNADITDNWYTHLYVGSRMYHWEFNTQNGFSRVGTRQMRLRLYHAFDGWWVTDGVYCDAVDNTFGITSNNSGAFGNRKSLEATGKTISEWHFMAASTFDKGTIIEIYGK